MWTSGKALLKTYGVLWMTAVGGIVGANLSAVIGMSFFVAENKATYVKPWAHGGWYAGTLLFLIGAITGQLRWVQGTSLGKRWSRSAEESSNSGDESNALKKDEPAKKRYSLMGCVSGFGLAGGILGSLLGASLLVFWFSLAYSPFASKETVTSVEVVEDSPTRAGEKRSVMQTDSSTVLYLCLTPAVVGVVVGAIAGGVIAMRQGEKLDG